MINYIGLLFFILFSVEAIIFAVIVSKIGFFATLFLCAIAGFAGLWIVREQGLSSMSGLIQTGQIRPEQITDGLFLFLAGLLFLFPGFLSDACGFLLLVPRVRHVLLSLVARKVPLQTAASKDRYADGSIIEGYFVVVEEEAHRIEDSSQKP